MNKRSQNLIRRGFTIIEVIVIVVILGIIAAVIAPRLLNRVGQSKQAVAKSNAEAIAQAVTAYMLDCGAPEPGATLSILMERPASVAEGAWKGPYLNNSDQLRDPWGNEYHLVVPGQVNVDFDIVSYGKDGQQNGEGENADIINGKR
jgi:general secretion pathway protein G